MKNNVTPYDNMLDEELVERARAGSEDCAEVLLRRYKNLVIKCARPYFIIGQEQDDLIQEGMIGLYKAILNYQKIDTKFSTFAFNCIRCSIIDAIKFAARLKHKPLNNYTPLLHQDGSEDEKLALIEASPEELAERLEGNVELSAKLHELLSRQELAVYNSYIKGIKIADIAETLGVTYKSVDNALQRIRRKIKLLFINN